MGLFKKKVTPPEVRKVIGIYTAQTKGTPVMANLEGEVKFPKVLEVLNYHHSVYIVEDVNEEYFKIISRYQPNKYGYVRKASGSYIMYSALPYSVIVHKEGDIAVYDSPNNPDAEKVGICKAGERLQIETEWDNFGKIMHKNAWVNLDEVNKLRADL